MIFKILRKEIGNTNLKNLKNKGKSCIIILKGFKHRDNSSKKRLTHTKPFFIFCKKM